MNLIGVATQRVGLGALLVLLPGQLCAQGQQPLPSTDEILERVIERTRWAEAQNHSAKYTFAQTVVTEKLDKTGALDEREVKLFQVVPLEGESYSRLIKKNGQPLSEEDRRAERKREQKFRRQLSERRQRKDDDRVRIDEELLSRFRINLMGREKVNGRPAFLLTFEPKRKDLSLGGNTG
jgi:hypothetical protein